MKKIIFYLLISGMMVACSRTEASYQYKFNVGDTVEIMDYYDGLVLDKKEGKYSVSYRAIDGIKTDWLDERILKSKKH